MQAYYAARAAEYDRIYLKPERQANLREMEAWVARVFEGRSVLEVACGTGYWTQFFAPGAARVLALDAADETMQIARGRVPAGKVRFMQADAYRIPPLAQTFDAAFAGFWWSHIPLDRVDSFLSGLHAALAPGAKIVFMDNRFVAGSSTPISESDADGNSYQTRQLSDGSTHRVLKNFPSRDELLRVAGRYSRSPVYREWDYYWALEYVLDSAPRSV
ncbi:MAG: class I SAM-dependent methyltransferase [Proteobacteria bacterium]|nr:class I SAM-dependent methyltransferase [Pseudomonadota bacterium]